LLGESRLAGRGVSNGAGRFAPSPTGALHSGSLLAAVGSYLDARANGARWLVRIEDLDTPRVIPGCADEMLRTLETFGFEWDGEVLYQSTRRDAYLHAIDQLRERGRIFECSCSRKQLAGAGGEDAPGYPGTCRRGATRPGPTSLRFRVSDSQVQFDDLFQGTQSFDLHGCGDVVVQRRDGIASYQLAVVLDDEFQGVTRVVRGADLLASTPWQLDLQDALSLGRPIYGHLPLVVEADGSKLSKSSHAVPLDPSQVAIGLTTTLTLLSQRPPADLPSFDARDVWKWAFEHWNPQALAGNAATRCPRPATSQQK
jgi:glutamyl-Q tRNA(Asp) synthetase